MQTVTPCIDLRLLISTLTRNSPPTEAGFFGQDSRVIDRGRVIKDIHEVTQHIINQSQDKSNISFT